MTFTLEEEWREATEKAFPYVGLRLGGCIHQINGRVSIEVACAAVTRCIKCCKQFSKSYETQRLLADKVRL